MPIPHWITRSNKRLLNPLMLRASSRVPPLATVHHTGRRSGRAFTTPVLAFAARAPLSPAAATLPEEARDVVAVVALTYGTDVDWLRNVLHAGSYRLERAGTTYVVDRLVVVEGDAGARLVPPLVDEVLDLLHVDRFLVGRVRRLVTAPTSGR